MVNLVFQAPLGSSLIGQPRRSQTTSTFYHWPMEDGAPQVGTGSLAGGLPESVEGPAHPNKEHKAIIKTMQQVGAIKKCTKGNNKI